MPWTVNLDEQFPWHRKVTRLSDQAFRLHIHAICWVTRAKTDGALTPEDLPDVAPRLRNRERLAAELVQADLWEATPPLGWVVHDYLDWNPSAYTRRALDQQKSASGQLGNHRRWHVQRGIEDPDCKHCIDAGQSQVRSQTGSQKRSQTDRT